MSKYNPDHYRLGNIEVWDFIVDQDLGYLEGNIIKYICRAGHKDGESRIDDLLKAQVYIHKLTLSALNDSTPRSDGPSPQVPSSNGATMCVEGCTCPLHAEEADS